MTEPEVIITDRIEQDRIIWISVTPLGIYSFFIMAGKENHSSYHKDGSLWNTVNWVKCKVAQFQPLSSFKGSHKHSAQVFSTDLSGNPSVPPYIMKKLDSAVYVDVRLYIKRSANVGVSITLLVPKCALILFIVLQYHRFA